jgi:hypothetical protein
MNRALPLMERHLCPDCQSQETQGRDKFGFPMPCARCLVERLVKAFHADLEDQATLGNQRLEATRLPEPDWLRQFA